MSDDLFSVEGKRILVTGGTSGIGQMMVEGLASRGARVYTCSRKTEAVDAFVKELAGRGLEIAGSACNVALTEEVDALVDAVGAHFGGALDAVVNNAGATWGAPIEEYPMDGWDKVFDLNVRGLFYVSQQCVPLLAAAATPRDPSRIVHVGSIAAMIQPRDNAFAYHAAKAAVHHLGHNMAQALAEKSITVNTLAPGVYHSRMTRYMFPGGEESHVTRGIPLHRVGEADDIVGATVFLCSRASAYMTGSELVVGGGIQL